jgi:probable F420-dependent oxidoreductase
LSCSTTIVQSKCSITVEHWHAEIITGRTDMSDATTTSTAAAAGTTPALGPIGIWSSRRQWSSDPGAAGEAAAELEELGFSAVWLGSSTGDLTLPETLLAATTTLVVATGIVDVWSAPAAVVAANHHRLTNRFSGRFLLGLGMGHAEIVETTTGQRYVRPLRKMASYLDELDAAEHPVPAGERVLAALGPKALGLAADRSAGAHPYNVTPEHTAGARALLGPARLLAPEQKILLGADPSEARETARRTLAMYLKLPNYVTNLRRLGFDDTDLAGSGSDRFLDALVAWGRPDAVAARVREHLDAGATHVPVQVLTARGNTAPPRAEWRRAAEALLP